MAGSNAKGLLAYLRLFAPAIALATLALACGPGEEPTPTQPVPTATATQPALVATPTATRPALIATPTPTATPTAIPAPVAKRGGVLRTFSSSDGCGQPTVELEGQTCVRGQALMAPMYSNLIRYDPYKYTKIVPDLATSWKFVAPNKWVFQLRTDAKWTDGTPVTPQDVVFSLNRAVERNKSRVGRELTPMWGGAAVSGPNEVTLANNPLSALFLAQMSTNHMKIYPEHVVSKLPKTAPLMTPANVVSSGPFRFKEWKNDAFFEVVRYEDYVTSAVAGVDLPYLDGVKTFIIPDKTAELAAFQAGQLDILPRFPNFIPSDVKPIQDFFKDRVVVVKSPDSTPIRVSSINVTRPPFNDPRVVRALWVSIDRPTLNNVLYDGLLIPGAILDPRVFPDAALSVEELASFPGLVKPDYELAKRLLADAGYPKGLEIPETITRNLGEYQDAAQIMLEGWKKAGITFAKHTIADALSTSTRTAAGDFYMTTYVRAGYAVPDPMEPLNAIFRVPGDYGYKDAALSALIEKALLTVDTAERNKLIKDIQRKIFTDMTFAQPMVGLSDVLLVQRSYVKDFGRSFTLFEEHRYDVMWLDK